MTNVDVYPPFLGMSTTFSEMSMIFPGMSMPSSRILGFFMDWAVVGLPGPWASRPNGSTRMNSARDGSYSTFRYK